nr:uncharacterized protein LOC129264045 [Lytechinus pictus]
MYFKMADYGSGKQHGQDKGFECPACKMKFSFRTNLNRHKRTIHKKETKGERTSCTIPGCTAKFYHQTKLLSHLEVVHGKHIDKTELTFSSMDKFFMWKMQEEAQNFVCFTKQRGCVTHSSVTHQHYICQRWKFKEPHIQESTRQKNEGNFRKVLSKQIWCVQLECCFGSAKRQEEWMFHITSHTLMLSHPVTLCTILSQNQCGRTSEASLSLALLSTKSTRNFKTQALAFNLHPPFMTTD